MATIMGNPFAGLPVAAPVGVPGVGGVVPPVPAPTMAALNPAAAMMRSPVPAVGTVMGRALPPNWAYLGAGAPIPLDPFSSSPGTMGGGGEGGGSGAAGGGPGAGGGGPSGGGGGGPSGGGGSTGGGGGGVGGGPGPGGGGGGGGGGGTVGGDGGIGATAGVGGPLGGGLGVGGSMGGGIGPGMGLGGGHDTSGFATGFDASGMGVPGGLLGIGNAEQGFTATGNPALDAGFNAGLGDLGGFMGGYGLSGFTGGWGETPDTSGMMGFNAEAMNAMGFDTGFNAGFDAGFSAGAESGGMGGEGGMGGMGDGGPSGGPAGGPGADSPGGGGDAPGADAGGFQRGGAFRVGGRGGPESQRISFRATPGEEVVVSPPKGPNPFARLPTVPPGRPVRGQPPAARLAAMRAAMGR